MEKIFKLKQRNTTVRTEILGGITTFLAMAYIILINPSIISHEGTSLFSGSLFNAVLFATCLSSAFGTLLMALIANFPLAQAPGMGLNAFFAFTAMPAMATLAQNPNLPLEQQYQMALAVVFMSGVLFLLITLFGAREAIIGGIPQNIRLAISAGLGIFIAYIGLQNAKIIVPHKVTQIALINFMQPDAMVTSGAFATTGDARLAIQGALLALLGLAIIAALYSLHVRGSIVIGMIATTILCYATGFSQLPGAGFSFDLATPAADYIRLSFFKLDFAGLFAHSDGLAGTIGTILVLVVSFSMVDMFDTIGVFVGTAHAAGLMNEDGEMEGMKKGLLCDALATTASGLLGTSSVSSYAESSAGINADARTGLSSLVTSALFIVALLLSPFARLIPVAATAPALIFVGCLMIGNMRKVNFDEITESLPAFLTIIMMPLTYSVANGIAFGVISYTILKIATGRFSEIKPATFVVTVLFIIRFFVSL